MEFNSDASNFREFLESEQRKVLYLQMVKVDEWTGLTKVHRVPEMIGCLTERQYTIWKLKRLLMLNQLIRLKQSDALKCNTIPITNSKRGQSTFGRKNKRHNLNKL
jgi:hypothetical protein